MPASLGESLIETAKRLLPTEPGRPRQSDLRRAISTAYYAVFHTLAKSNADLLALKSDGVLERAWSQVYRALQHGTFAQDDRKKRLKEFPKKVQTFVDIFDELRHARHAADYDPHRKFTEAEARSAIERAVNAPSLFDDISEKDKRALAVLSLLPLPKAVRSANLDPGPPAAELGRGVRAESRRSGAS